MSHEIEGGADLWLVGQNIAETEAGIVWSFQGVFPSEAEAVAACESPRYFLAPIRVGRTQPVETAAWEGCYYPIVATHGETT